MKECTMKKYTISFLFGNDLRYVETVVADNEIAAIVLAKYQGRIGEWCDDDNFKITIKLS